MEFLSACLRGPSLGASPASYGRWHAPHWSHLLREVVAWTLHFVLGWSRMVGSRDHMVSRLTVLSQHPGLQVNTACSLVSEPRPTEEPL